MEQITLVKITPGNESHPDVTNWFRQLPHDTKPLLDEKGYMRSKYPFDPNTHRHFLIYQGETPQIHSEVIETTSIPNQLNVNIRYQENRPFNTGAWEDQTATGPIERMIREFEKIKRTSASTLIEARLKESPDLQELLVYNGFFGQRKMKSTLVTAQLQLPSGTVLASDTKLPYKATINNSEGKSFSYS